MVALVPDSSQCASRWPRKLPALVKVVAAVVCVVVLDHVCLRRRPLPHLAAVGRSVPVLTISRLGPTRYANILILERDFFLALFRSRRLLRVVVIFITYGDGVLCLEYCHVCFGTSVNTQKWAQPVTARCMAFADRQL